MIVERVTKEMLFKLNVNDQKVFTLPNYGKARSAQSYANQLKKATIGTREQREFKAVIGDPNPENGQCPVTITRLA
jgi:hypothetical protein